MVEGATHTGMNKCFMNIIVARSTGLHAHVLDIGLEVLEGLSIGFLKSFGAVQKKENSKRKNKKLCESSGGEHFENRINVA
jgi:hypothetical protein